MWALTLQRCSENMPWRNAYIPLYVYNVVSFSFKLTIYVQPGWRNSVVSVSSAFWIVGCDDGASSAWTRFVLWLHWWYYGWNDGSGGTNCNRSSRQKSSRVYVSYRQRHLCCRLYILLIIKCDLFYSVSHQIFSRGTDRYMLAHCSHYFDGVKQGILIPMTWLPLLYS